MINKTVDFSRQVFNKQKFQDTVDTQFTQLVQIPDETFFDVNLATVEDFFIIYDNIFLEIPQRGENNSHEFLIKESSEYIDFQANQAQIQALLDEIAELRETNLQLQLDMAELLGAKNKIDQAIAEAQERTQDTP